MIDINKTYRTRDGREARIYATDGCAERPVHGAYQDKLGWRISNWFSNGDWGVNRIKYELDLIEVRPRHKKAVWLNVYGTGIIPEACSSKERADAAAGCNRIACIKVELDFAEGEGL